MATNDPHPADSRSPGSRGPRLDDPIQFIKGVGEKRAVLLRKLGIETAGDLLTFFPRRWEDRSRFARLAEVGDGQSAVFNVRFVSVENRTTRSGKTVTKAVVTDGSASAEITFFNQPWLREKLMKLRSVSVPMYGTVSRDMMGGWYELKEVEWDETALTGGPGNDSLLLGRIVPFYNLTDGLQQNAVRRITRTAIPVLAPLVEEALPDYLLNRRQMPSAQSAYLQIHWPDDEQKRLAARTRLAFEELFLLQVALAVRRKTETLDMPGIAIEVPEGFIDEFEAKLPFRFTSAQKRCLDEIIADMRQPRPMNRLLQGDVGSGKTVVAAAAMLAAARAGYQAAVMAPTEILAEQHATTLRAILKPMGFEVELLTGGITGRRKKDAQDRVALGLSTIVVGTHALIQETVEFRNLGLVVVDEQHRFGVVQRAALRQKASNPDVLVMTATPIPRTLALVVYGDLDVSVINEMPPGRQPITTHFKRSSERRRVYEGIEKLLAQGRQAYIVCPLVEESEKLQTQAVTALYEQLSQRIFPHRRIGLVHGQMSSGEKDSQMDLFRRGETDVLVATTVIEVGVDIPNATVMVVEDADRFGLSQLHQLRGRVGRGSERSFCVLVANPSTDVAERRLKVMTDTQDGFVIAEEDLRLRGPGELWGTKQTGMPSFRIANILEDVPILEEARAEAFTLVADDPNLDRPEHQALKQAVRERFSGTLLAVFS